MIGRLRIMSESGIDVPASIDPRVPSTARVYDAGLGGKDNYEVDRELLHKMQQVAPEITELALASREFLVRACRFLARDVGITQFLDCGSGLPTVDNVHQVVQRYNSYARVVYVDNDPVVNAHGRALLAEDDRSHFTSGNIFRPDELLHDETIRGELDWDEPVGLIHSMSMHFCADSDATSVMRDYVAALPAGSFVVFSHAFDPEDDHQEIAEGIEQVYAGASSGAVRFRTRAELETMLGGLELLDPGLVRPAEWWPSGPRSEPLKPAEHCLVAAVGRTPAVS